MLYCSISLLLIPSLVFGGFVKVKDPYFNDEMQLCMFGTLDDGMSNIHYIAVPPLVGPDPKGCGIEFISYSPAKLRFGLYQNKSNVIWLTQNGSIVNLVNAKEQVDLLLESDDNFLMLDANATTRQAAKAHASHLLTNFHSHSIKYSKKEYRCLIAVPKDTYAPRWAYLASAEKGGCAIHVTITHCNNVQIAHWPRYSNLSYPEDIIGVNSVEVIIYCRGHFCSLSESTIWGRVKKTMGEDSECWKKVKPKLEERMNHYIRRQNWNRNNCDAIKKYSKAENVMEEVLWKELESLYGCDQTTTTSSTTSTTSTTKIVTTTTIPTTKVATTTTSTTKATTTITSTTEPTSTEKVPETTEQSTTDSTTTQLETTTGTSEPQLVFIDVDAESSTTPEEVLTTAESIDTTRTEEKVSASYESISSTMSPDESQKSGMSFAGILLLTVAWIGFAFCLFLFIMMLWKFDGAN